MKIFICFVVAFFVLVFLFIVNLIGAAIDISKDRDACFYCSKDSCDNCPFDNVKDS